MYKGIEIVTAVDDNIVKRVFADIRNLKFDSVSGLMQVQ